MNTIDALLAAPQLAPFVPISENSCRSCGMHVGRWGKFCSWLQNRMASVVDHHYCAGGKPPTESRGMMSAIVTGETETFNPCAGITEPHIHIRCRGCGYKWLMKPMEGKL